MEKLMANLELSQCTSENIISTTLYRALLLVRLLLIKPLSLPEIRKIFEKDKIIGPKISEDSIRMTIMTLKSVGCVFAKPSQKNNFTYKLLKCPFLYSLSEENIEFLKELREQLAPYVSWNNLLKINKLYSKLNETLNETENKFDLSEQAIFLNHDLEILFQLSELCAQRVFINMTYCAQNIAKEMFVVPLFMKYESGNAYVWCYNEEISGFSFLRADRIKRINKVMRDKEIPQMQFFKAKLKIKKEIYDGLSLDYNIKLINELKNCYEIEVEYMSEYHLIQKVLEMATDCEVLEPMVLRNKVIQKLVEMKEQYK